jgi:NADP oxidoreductase coenzyme F420-dependent
LIADHLHDPSVRGGIVECRSPDLGLTIGVTTVGFIGSGRIGGTVARLAIAAGYDVVLSNSRVPQNLKDLVEELGPQARAATPAGAAAAGDLVVVSIPPRAYPAVPVGSCRWWWCRCPRYSLNTRSNRKPATPNTVVSGPTKTSARTVAVAGVRAALATALAAARAAAGQADVIP